MPFYSTLKSLLNEHIFEMTFGVICTLRNYIPKRVILNDVCLCSTSLGGDLTCFFIFQAIPVSSLSQVHPFIEPKDLVDAHTKLGVDCKAAMLCGTNRNFSLHAVKFLHKICIFLFSFS